MNTILHSLACSTVASTVAPGEVSSGSNNLQMTIIIVCVVLLLIILLLVLMFLLYRRRALCFGKVKRDRTDKNIHVELHNVENAEETTYDKIDDNLGNPLYASVGANDDDTAPMLSPVKKKADEFIPSKGSFVIRLKRFIKKNCAL